MSAVEADVGSPLSAPAVCLSPAIRGRIRARAGGGDPYVGSARQTAG